MLFNGLLWIHIVAGFIALATFWIPMATDKGGKRHRYWGRVFVYAMYTVSVTALVMSPMRLFGLIPNLNEAFSVFLMFIGVLAGVSAWYGHRVLRGESHRRLWAHRDPKDLIPSTILFASGIATSVYGFSINDPLVSYFPILGVINGGAQLKYWLLPPSSSLEWVFQHMTGMVGACISTITAFVVFSLPRLLGIEQVSVWLWVAPGAILSPLTFYWAAKYRKKMAKFGKLR